MKSSSTGIRVFEVLTLVIAAMLSIGTIWMLFQYNRGLTASREYYYDNLPSYSVKAEYDLARLISTLNEFMVGTSSAEDIQLRYDIFLVRLNHYESAFATINRQSNEEVRYQLDILLRSMQKVEESVFALQMADAKQAATVSIELQGMYEPIEELTTLTREAHNQQLRILDATYSNGVRVGFVLILATVLIGALLVTYFWYNLKEKIRFNLDLEKQVQSRTQDLLISNDSLMQEIKERQRAEVALAEREQKIHRVQKMEAVGRVTSGVAH